MEKYRKCFPDMEQEEKWLNEMAEKGLVLTRVAADFFSSRYYFEQGDSAYTYRVDYERDEDYINFVKDTCNAEYVCTADNKLYFRKAKEQGEFASLYSDLKSRYNAERQAFWRSLALSPVFLIDIFWLGPDVLGTIIKNGLNAGTAFLSAIWLLCAIFWAYYFYKAVKCRRKLNELKKSTERN